MCTEKLISASGAGKEVNFIDKQERDLDTASMAAAHTYCRTHPNDSYKTYNYLMDEWDDNTCAFFNADGTTTERRKNQALD